ncbi:alkylation response protein AidB-like acyl-CoA dehydrogenase [Prauserella sediminis]|uniref:Alkylation response protein AidB-like acyl-CoA dehydrogenase n=1 Tax=Prauserella sediminis TaxID=577680 RepID=A0A839XZZ5_9PSEU|nr:acyl-CoA dehydrogenase family protein [Prauserella sediminis]MBB3665616.1 alkylation response protein AidB-like acyl-CoA dehydrogenase [Prauserella sediminis]
MNRDKAPDATQQSVLDNVRALQPEIRERATEIESARQVPKDLVEKLRSAGIFRRYVPRSHGGDEAWPDQGLTVIEEIARADASVAWVSAVGSEGASFYAYLPTESYDKIYAGGPDVVHTGVINATGRAVQDGDGYRFTGQWSFASGCAGADYICLNGVVDGAPAGDGPPLTRFAVVPPSEVEIVDTWHVSGLKGTGSHDIKVEDLYVPAEWTGTFTQLPEVPRHPLDQRPLLARFGLEFAAVGLGVAQGALDDILAIAQHKTPATAKSKLAADPVAQYLVGQLATDLHMARTLLHSVAQEDQGSVAAGVPGQDWMAARKARLSRVASVSASVVEAAYDVSGTTGLFESCPLQRRMRDVRAVTQHFLLSARNAFGPAGAAVLAPQD